MLALGVVEGVRAMVMNIVGHGGGRRHMRGGLKVERERGGVQLDSGMA